MWDLGLNIIWTRHTIPDMFKARMPHFLAVLIVFILISWFSSTDMTFKES